jgi:hypothetical protein
MVQTLKNLTTLILFVIYVPVAITIIVKWKKKVIKFIVLPIAIVSLPVLYLVIFSIIPYYYLMPFEGKVIDADTKEPIEGAVVLAVYYDEATSIAGTNTFPIDAQEALTDSRGEFKIPEVKRWFGDRPGTVVDARLTIFKPGYGVFPTHKGSKAVKDTTTPPTSVKHIIYDLPKLKTVEERKANLFFEYYAGFPPDKTGQFVCLVNEERKNLGLPLISIPEEEKEK